MDPKFSFPFQPYDIQKQFMTELYFTIQDNKLGIFESPTGTVSISTLRVLPDFMDFFLIFYFMEICDLQYGISSLK